MLKTLLAGIILSPCVALSGTGGSSYSLFGIGDLRYLPNARSAAMGYSGLGLPSANYINSIQPAAWARINKVRVEAGIQYEGYNSSDASKSLYLANTDFSGALLAIPISTDIGMVTVLGFTPYSNVNYNLFMEGTQENIQYQINHAGAGGMSRGVVGLSYSPLTDLAVGASFNYLFGSIDRTTTFSPSNTSFAGGVTTETMTLRGINVSLGGMFTGFGRISESLQPFSLGFVVTTRASLKSERETRFEFLTENDTLAIAKGRVIIPLAYGFGMAYQASDRYLIAADYYAQHWANTTLHGIDPPEIRNMFRMGLGGEKLPERDASGWFSRLAYRLGMYYHSSYYKINGEPINELGITGGIAVPFFGDARLSTAFEYCSRGTRSSGLVKDKVFRMTFSVTLSEPWFQRFEEE